jgi:hypothetical protein
MEWHVRYRPTTSDLVLWFATPEAAIEAACLLMDDSHDVLAIGTDDLGDSIGPREIARIYGFWDRAKPRR